MSSYIAGLKDRDGNPVYPETTVEAVPGLEQSIQEIVQEVVVEESPTVISLDLDDGILSVTLSKEDGTEISTDDVDISAISSNTYTHTQSQASATWNIQHNLNRYPSVAVTDSSGNEVVGEVKYVDSNNVQCKFGGAFSGIAYLN